MANEDIDKLPVPRVKPTHYKVICISLYTRDQERLTAMVAKLKDLGWSKANKSHLIRFALENLEESDLVLLADTHGEAADEAESEPPK